MTRIRAAFIALLIASVALAAYGDRIGGNGPEFMPRDPGAIRAKNPYFQHPVTFASGSTPLAKITNLGGHAISLYNGSGVIASAGNIVVASTTAGYFGLAPAESAAPIGAVYQDVAPGAQGWVVVSGVGDVKLASTETATSGWLLLTDDGEAGRAMSATAVPPTTQAEHNREIGHTISTQPTAGGLVRAVLHFN